MIRQVEYFEKAGKANLDRCSQIIADMVENEGFKHVVVASTTGASAVCMQQALSGKKVNLVAVTHSYGFKEPNSLELPEQTRKELEDKGVKICTTTILTHSIETAFAEKGQGVYPTQVVAHSLRRMGEGTKVVCEIVMEAVDCGLIPEGEMVIAAAGTGHGADTVCVIKSAASKRFLKLFVSEFRAKPA